MQSLLPQDLNTTNDILSNTITVLENSVATGFNTTNVETQEVIVDIFNNVLGVNNREGWQSLQTVSAGSQLLLNNVERFGLYVANSEANTSTILSRPNIVLSAMQYGQDSTMPVTFPTPEDLVNVSIQNLPATITIPADLLQERLQEGKAVPVVNVLFQNLERFLPAATGDISNNSMAVSAVLSSQVALQSSSSLVLRENPITLLFTFEQGAVSQGAFRCIFWNFSEPIGNGGWISDGVRTVGSNTDSQGRTRVECESTHLTSFAVLVDVTDVTGVRTQLEALRVVSYIGCAISLGCLAIAIVFYLFQRKKLFTPNLVRFVHLNLAISLFLAYLTFVVGVELARNHKVSECGFFCLKIPFHRIELPLHLYCYNQVACIVVAALLHYLFLAAFCWMLCEGVMIFLMLVVVFSTLSRKWWFFLLLGYGVPVLFVVIGLAARHEYYGVKDDEGRPLFCWLSTEKGVIWAFVAPMLGIITINVVFLFLALWRVIQTKRNQFVEKKKEPVIIATSLLKATIVLLPLLGLTWVFGLLTINQNTIVFAWIFTILNSVQGAGIFFLHVIRDKMVWPKLTSKFSVCCRKDTSNISSLNHYTVSSVKRGRSDKEKEVQEVAHVNIGQVEQMKSASEAGTFCNAKKA